MNRSESTVVRVDICVVASAEIKFYHVGLAVVGCVQGWLIGWYCVCILAASRAEYEPSAATGAVMQKHSL